MIGLKSYQDIKTPEELDEEREEAVCKAEQFLKEGDIDNAIRQANEGLDLDKIAKEVEKDIKEQKEIEK